ncbi:MAG: PolC-type DNA polymerase III [Lachnospiraceae bacterium]|nr:PolC-type DNA polymerase III [Lachnospiraceae bacterium]
MDQGILDLFPDIKIEENFKKILQGSSISRITWTKDHTEIRIYFNSDNLIPKRRIWKLEKAIYDKYFKADNINVKIIERFNLSDRYDPQTIYDSYRDSILEEIRNYNVLLFYMVKSADFSFCDDDKLIITIEDTNFAKNYEEDIHRIFHKIFCERCAQNIIIDFAYKKPDKKTFNTSIDEKVASISMAFEKAKEEEMSENQNEKEDSKETKSKKSNRGSFKRSENAYQKTFKANFLRDPNKIYGQEGEGELLSISELVEELEDIIVRGQIRSVECRPIRNEKTIVTVEITDFTDTVAFKIFMRNEKLDYLLGKLKTGDFIKVLGDVKIDDFDHEMTINPVKFITSISDFRPKREDLSVEKRVELHCHTKMSDMDGVSDVTDIIKKAKAWGHKAIAITDHGVVQSFPEADHMVGDDPDFKVIYGCEIYLVDDTKKIAIGDESRSLDETFVVFDIETLGLNAAKVPIIEIGAVKFEQGKITDRFSEFINPGVPIPYRIVELTGITDLMVSSAPDIEVILPKFREFCGDAVLVAHNADFDTGATKAWCKRLGIDWEFSYLDTVSLARFLLPGLSHFKLDQVAKELGIPLINHHRAVEDAECTAHIFEKFLSMLSDMNIHTLGELNVSGTMDDAAIKKSRANHCIILAKNDIGRINLYRLVSISHLNYFSRFPKVPKSLLAKHREGLIIGSACEAGELYQAILTGKADEEVARIVSFYDYLEIQPDGNNSFLIGDDKYGIESEEDLHEINRRIVALGEEFSKPVVATCDVHFLNPEDEIYRRIIMAAKKFKDADSQAPLYLHTTEEMLSEFSYLGSEKAREVVIKNTSLISDMCERIHPTRPDKCPPVIEHSDEMLRKICYDRAHEIYGDTLPEVVTARLERELNSIISNGYAVMYIIAQKLVWKSVEDGYLVGSRGSVGSSFVATMAGITEVNPLSAHYICPKCHYVDFDSDEVKAFAGRAGCDMPDKLCPKCNTPLAKDGFDIPFETFLGFKGNKEPDIDLNFSAEYQNKAHRYTEVIFGEGQTFRAGTIGTLADKTAYGYIKNYYEERGENKRAREINRIVSGCVGIRRTTGQHPGGIIVLPVGEEIFTFTPVQHPPKDEDIITTHFDYHSIDSNLLKLDILGHDDPTMIRMLEDITKMDATKIPLDAPEVMQLFLSTEPLGVESEDLWRCDRGTFGIPEFGTDFAMGMLRDAKPKEFSDLIRISGLSHGTDVWLGNAQDLILSGTATISTAICTRDDIMIYLIGKGLDSEESFKIMEAVRKGTVAKGKCKTWPEWKQDMIDHDVPDWYIGSCEKIKYMFPKAHAAAYVMMAWRIAYFKIHEPLAYYAAYFSIRTNFDYEKMCQGKGHVEQELKDLEEKKKILSKEHKKLTANEDKLYMDLRSVHEMYARGFEFLPLDIYKSDARRFKVVDGKLLPPLNCVEGLGDSAAEMLQIAASKAPFMSKKELKERGKITGTVIETLEKLGVLPKLPESDQLSIFDLF